MTRQLGVQAGAVLILALGRAVLDKADSVSTLAPYYCIFSIIIFSPVLLGVLAVTNFKFKIHLSSRVLALCISMHSRKLRPPLRPSREPLVAILT